ncbi:MAG TPA: hypothetical protein PKO24_03175 [Methanomassiliicoccales archaeon]|jgi:O-antigen/teichoic acid export membrane protein|nr:hypothetical protein [Methanomassiliicoccales archaeon]
MSKPLTVEWGLEIAVSLIVLGAVLLIVGILDVLHLYLDLGGWGFYSGAVGVLLLIVGIVWMVSILQRMRKFKLLVQEKSKAVFVRSLDELEYTVWRLPSKYDALLLEKRREMGLK